MSDQPRIYARHLREAGFCLSPGGREWFKQNGLDWRAFLREGIPVSSVADIDDALCRRVCEIALKDKDK